MIGKYSSCYEELKAASVALPFRAARFLFQQRMPTKARRYILVRLASGAIVILSGFTPLT
jgi:hypothetical protein